MSSKMIWTIVFVVAGVFLAVRAATVGMGRAYVQKVQVVASGTDRDGNPVTEEWDKYENADYKDYLEANNADATQDQYSFSLIRTIGIWVAALFTIFVLSFLFRDNPLYKIAESVFVGVSAAYWMVVAFWDTIVPNLFAQLSPGLVRAWAMPGINDDVEASYVYVVPLILGVMLLWRLSPVGGWISRWPMAFFIGTFCGLRLIRFLHADFLSQIRNAIIPLWAVDETTGSFQFWPSLHAVILVLGVLTCLVYFFFSIEHRGFVGKTARVGIWFLMITFGAAFGYTVMGRIALLAIRLEFLMDDWLWLIDPTGKREIAEAATAVVMPALSFVSMLT